ncbi:prostatic spermine-binding protein-like [Vigna radiata var. radiata]|uniref:Prostatic spermine-binding protein-like n=1 Tax=Vigna radiata var. radiata TaxID=3916 RepID=A0A3Q0F871_VIGRR|nr:prostatic spermine-binding protein-like [Vigna radiata var. radiata]
MEPFSGEECHSSESGWTMYIGSPMDDAGHSDDADNDHQLIQTDPQNDDDDDDDDDDNDESDDDDDDDSMASDASSGPSHLGINHGFPDFQRDAQEECDADKCCLEKKANKSQLKQMEGKKVENKGMLFVATKDKSPVQGCAKVKRNFVGKRK